jgi:hypothetical protein
MLAWAQTMVFAATGRPPRTLADLDALPRVLRASVADCLSGDPLMRPTAAQAVLGLLGEAHPPAGVLAEGTRRAARALGAGPRAHGGPPLPAEAGPGRRAARSPARAGSRRRSAGRPGVLPVAAAVVVVAVVAVIVVHVLQSTGTAGGQAVGSTTPLRTGGSPAAHHAKATAPATPADAGTVPSSYAGSWSGRARQLNPPNEFDVRLRLSAGSPRGTVTYSNSSTSCTGELSMHSSTASALTLTQGIVTGRHTCANGQVTLSESTNGTLQFTFHGKVGPDVSGTLSRT